MAARWTRLCFGWNQSPELSTAYYYWAEEFIRSNHLDKQNPLRWDKVVLNLIGNENVNPSLPNVFK